ncbi:MAG: aminotransferase class IV [Chloroflexota bacterium]
MSIKVFALANDLSAQELPIYQNEKSLDDISRKLPQGLYSTFRTYGEGRLVIGLKAHFDRLFVPALEKNINPSISAQELRIKLRELLEAYRPGEARVRICMDIKENPGQVYIIVEKLRPIEEDVYKNGISVVTSHVERVNPRLKTTSFIQKSETERKFLLENNIYEGIIVWNNHLLEGLTSNFYSVKNLKVITAQKSILLGVTRRTILKIIRAEGIQIEYRALRIDEIRDINEAFITSSSRGVVPVVSIDGNQIGEGIPGPIAKRLRVNYEDYVLLKAEVI